MIIVLTKTIHVKEIQDFFDDNDIKYRIYNRFNLPKKLPKYDIGISYAWSRLVPKSEILKCAWVNYHPSLLPKYKGGDPYKQMFERKETHCGNTVHLMTEHYDEGKIIYQESYELNHPPISRDEIGAIAHYKMFEFFKDTVLGVIDILNSQIYYQSNDEKEMIPCV